MWTIIAKNSSGSDKNINDLGVLIANGSQTTLSDYFSYTEIANSIDLRTFVNAESLVINDGTADLAKQDGLDYLKIVHIYYLKDYYTKTELQTSGQAEVHWDNISNAPSFGTPKWKDPVLYIAQTIAATAPSSPDTGDVYIDTDDNHYYKWNGTTWTDLGLASTNDRVINLNDNGDVYTFNGTTWTDGGTTEDSSAVMVGDDGDGKAAQYIYDSTTSSWVKIGDVDFTGHFDGGANKHDASEIDVEGTYANIPGTPTDLESTISSINTELGTIAGNITNHDLDDAYDAGRTINTDAGPVVLDTGTATNAPLQITPKSSLPSSGLADGQLAIKSAILCVYDNARGKWLSVDRQIMVFGRQGASKEQYLNFFAGQLPSNNSGIRMIRNATVVGMSAQLDATGTANFRLRKNDSVTNIATLSVSGSDGAQDGSSTVNYDVDAGDYIQAYVQNSTSVEDPMFYVEFAIRP